MYMRIRGRDHERDGISISVNDFKVNGWAEMAGKRKGMKEILSSRVASTSA